MWCWILWSSSSREPSGRAGSGGWKELWEHGEDSLQWVPLAFLVIKAGLSSGPGVVGRGINLSWLE